MTKDDEEKVKKYTESRDAKIRQQQEALTAQEVERLNVIAATTPVRDKYFEELWASKPDHYQMERIGRGHHSRRGHVGKTGNYDVLRHMTAEYHRLCYRGKKYMSLHSYKIMPAAKVIIFTNFHGCSLYLKYFVQLILIIWSFKVFNIMI